MFSQIYKTTIRNNNDNKFYMFKLKMTMLMDFMNGNIMIRFQFLYKMSFVSSLVR